MVQASTVLIADKDQAVIRLLKTVLANAGHEVLLASSDDEIFELMEKKTIDAALIDYGLKGSSGLEIARKISQDYPDVPVALVAYYGTARSGLAANDAGVRRFLLKPFDDLAAVGRTIREILELRLENLRRRSGFEEEEEEESTACVRAVVADTSDEDRRQIGEALEKLGCEVTYATCAQEALLRLNDKDHEVLVIGYDMGDMTADDVLLRAKRVDQDLAVIVTSLRPSLQMTTSLLKRGAAAFIEKPLVDPQKTAHAILRHGLAVIDLRVEDQEEGDDEEAAEGGDEGGEGCVNAADGAGDGEKDDDEKGDLGGVEEEGPSSGEEEGAVDEEEPEESEESGEPEPEERGEGASSTEDEDAEDECADEVVVEKGSKES